jgi:hypothetical protein
MYRKKHYEQVSIYDFILPFGGHLKKDNRWVILREMIDWAAIEDEYIQNFDNNEAGPDGYPSDVAFGALYIQRKLRFTDRELVDQIAENPYMQYFLGYKEYINEKPFDPSLLVHFRKRFPEETMNRIIEKMFIEKADDNNPGGGGSSGGGSLPEQEQDCEETDKQKPEAPSEPLNRGTLVMDASCAPADIAYPTDLELCDKARKWTEVILDHFWKLYGSVNGKNEKPRTYREVARRRFLKLNKRRRKSAKKIRKELRYQLGCIKRNLGYIEAYELTYGTDRLFRIECDRLDTIKKFYPQQKEMFDNKSHSVADRIVSLSQPWIRPIVRGKTKSPTEFGAKISISVVNGYTFIDRLSFDAYNEGEAEEFERIVEEYRRRFGCYPARILADKIYRSKNNRAFCKIHGIHLSGPKLGRPGKDHAEERRIELQEVGERNIVEGKFGNGKRKLGLSLVMAKLKETAGTMISMDVFILNMEHFLRQRKELLYAFFETQICLLVIRISNREQVFLKGLLT